MSFELSETKEEYLKRAFFIVRRALSSYNNIAFIQRTDVTEDSWELTIYGEYPTHPYATKSQFTSNIDYLTKYWNEHFKLKMLPVDVKFWSDDETTIKVRLSYNTSTYYKQVAEFEVTKILED